jgi:hypothetical protein
MKYLKLFEEYTDNKIVYHGSLDYFKKFKKKTCFFCDDPEFAVDYANTKSLDGGLDADAILYKCKFSGKLFNPNNPEDMSKLESILPNETDVSHGQMWFLNGKVDKEELIKNLKGIRTITPVEEIANANIGDVVENPSYRTESLLVLDKDENYVYTIKKNWYDSYIDASSVGHHHAFRFLTDYKDIFEPWREALLKCYEETTGYVKSYGGGHPASLDANDYTNLVNTYKYAKKGCKYDYFNPKSNWDIVTYTPEQIKKIDDIYAKCLAKFEAEAKVKMKEKDCKKWTTKVIEEPMNDILGNFSSFENEVVMNLLKKLGYDGHISIERGKRTYGIYNPVKTVEILEVKRA